MTDSNKTIVLATHNAGKIRELGTMMAAHNLTVVGADAFPDVPDVEETGVTFEENALLKARSVAESTGLVAVADDSGVEVDALQGAPGVYSARYSNDWPPRPDESQDTRNIRKLLHVLRDVPQGKRTGRFVCAMAVCTPAGQHMTVRGTWEGVILDAPRGQNGFGYDPVFFDPTAGKTAAELTQEEKNARSHRGKALRLLLDGWTAFMARV